MTTEKQTKKKPKSSHYVYFFTPNGNNVKAKLQQIGTACEHEDGLGLDINLIGGISMIARTINQNPKK